MSVMTPEQQEKARQNWQKSVEERDKLINILTKKGVKLKQPKSMSLKSLREILNSLPNPKRKPKQR